MLFGGTDGDSGARLGDTWEWDGTSWSLAAPADPNGQLAPRPRFHPALVHDTALGRTVLSGGSAGEHAILGDTWEWDGLTWTPVEGSGPEAGRYDAAATYDELRRHVVLFGGVAARTPGGRPQVMSDTWKREGGAWVRVDPGHTDVLGEPWERPPRWGGFLTTTYDSHRSRVVLFGTREPAADGEIWEWNGRYWSLAVPAVPQEAEWAGEEFTGWAIAYDAARRQTVVFGGTLTPSHTWIWDGTNLRRAVPEDPEGDGNPISCGGQSLAFDQVRGRMLLSWGVLSWDIWEWDGVSWARIPGELPGVPAPCGWCWGGLAFDALAGLVTLYGGNLCSLPQGCVEDGLFWSWDGTTWSSVAPTDPEGDGSPDGRPNRRLDGRIVHDESRGRLQLLDDSRVWSPTPGSSWSGLWEWTGRSFSKVPTADPEGDGNPHARGPLAYDSANARSVFVPKFADPPGGAWLWDSGVASRPAHLLAVSLHGTRTLPANHYESLQVAFVSGGAGVPDGQPTSGAELLSWQDGRWHQVDVRDDGLDADGEPVPGTLRWSTEDEDVIERSILGAEQTINFAVAPTAPNGTGYGRIVTDYLEVRLRYRVAPRPEL